MLKVKKSMTNYLGRSKIAEKGQTCLIFFDWFVGILASIKCSNPKMALDTELK